MNREGRIVRLEERMGRRERPALLVVIEEDDGGWTVPGTGERVDRTAVPPTTLVVVFGVRPDGPR